PKWRGHGSKQSHLGVLTRVQFSPLQNAVLDGDVLSLNPTKIAETFLEYLIPKRLRGGERCDRNPMRLLTSPGCASTTSGARIRPTVRPTASPICRTGHLVGMAGGSLADLNYGRRADAVMALLTT